MKTFKHIDVAALPKGWTADFFGEAAEFSMGKTPSRSNDDFWSDGIYPWVAIADMEPFGRIRKTKESISELAHREVFRKRLIPAGSLLMSFKLTIGRVARLGIPAYHNEAIISFRPRRTDVDPEFLFYQLSQINYRKYQDTVVKGQTLNKGKLNELELVLPPLIEQRAIADVVGLIRRSIEEHRRSLELAGELKRGILQRVTRLEGLDEDGSAGAKPHKPEEWKMVRLGDVCDLSTGTTPATARSDYYKGDVPFIKTGEITNNRLSKPRTFISKEAVNDYRLKLYPAGTILMAMYGQGKTRGQVALLEVPATTSQNAAAIQPSKDIDGEFLWQWLMGRYSQLRGMGALGHLSHLNLGYVRDFLVPKPPISMQREIAVALHAIDKKIALIQSKVQLLEELFAALLHEVMTGNIRVHDLTLRDLERAAAA